jgi:hypothetical protein
MIGGRRFDIENVDPGAGDAPDCKAAIRSDSTTIGPREVLIK